MRRLSTSTILFATLLLVHPVLADGDSERPTGTPQTTAPQATAPEAGTPDSAAAPADAAATAAALEVELPPHQWTRSEICDLIESAASEENLPFEFFARLIWQESRFNPQAVSAAGAQGIAQFMPKTASGRGLADPFEPASALQESAEFLRELRQRFGNVGLAAAAYNAGPKRVQNWLAKRASLPRETQNYVAIITGHAAEKWVKAELPSAEDAEFQCNEIAQVVAQRRGSAILNGLAKLVARRMNGETKVRGSARKGILAKRAAPPSAAKQQVAKVAAQSRGRLHNIIRITAQGHNQTRVAVNVASQPRKKVEKPVKLAEASQPKKTAAQTREHRPASGKIRVAFNNAKSVR